jgi:glucokinase-like ROK family protein
VSELADERDLGSRAARRGGSNPPFPIASTVIVSWRGGGLEKTPVVPIDSRAFSCYTLYRLTTNEVLFSAAGAMRSRSTADHTLVRNLNTSLVLEHLRTQAPLSRADISARTGLNPSTVSNAVRYLIARHMVREVGPAISHGGRPGRLLDLSPEGGCVVGAEIGVDFVNVVLTNFRAERLWQWRDNASYQTHPTILSRRAADLVEEALHVGLGHGLRPLGIGLGVPGLVDVARGELVMSPNLGLTNVPFRDLWTERFQLPVFVDNEANTAAWGEYFFGGANAARSLVFLSTGIGLGGGIILNGELFHGHNGFAGEVGHITMVAHGGELCGCGKRGCWETLVTPRAIIKHVKREIEASPPGGLATQLTSGLGKAGVDAVVEAACQGDGVCAGVLERVAFWLGMGIGNLVNTFNPERVVLGGALATLGAYLLPAIVRTAREHMLPPLRDTQVVMSTHGADAAVMGAVAMVLADVLHAPVQ